MSNLFRKSLEKIPDEKKLLVGKLFDITDRILDILERKNMTQKELAKRLKKSEGEISKWMKGTHNFTEETIAKIEMALGEPITITMKQAEEKYNGLMKKMEEKTYSVITSKNSSNKRVLSPENTVMPWAHNLAGD